MSMYGDDGYHKDMNYLYEEILSFLDSGHPVSELIKIVSDAVEARED